MEDDPETSKDDSSITLSDECIAELATKLAEALKVVKEGGSSNCCYEL